MYRSPDASISTVANGVNDAVPSLPNLYIRDILSICCIDSKGKDSDMLGYEIDGTNQHHRTVLEMGRMYFEGNIIPPAWFDCLRYDSDEGQGRPHTNAIIILSEIVYWYRPVEVRDEATGRLVGYRKKFKGDRLQRSRRSFEEQFGFSKKQVTDAIAFLEKRGVIKKDIVKSFTTDAGQRIGNVMYLEIIPDGIRRITPVVTITTLEPTSNRVVPVSNTLEPTGATLEPTSKTNTETTTETTTNDATAVAAALRLVGMTGKQRRDILAAQPDLTPGEIAAWQPFRAEPPAWCDKPEGYIYRRLMDRDAPPEERTNGKGAVSDEEAKRQYLENFYSTPATAADYRNR